AVWKVPNSSGCGGHRFTVVRPSAPLRRPRPRRSAQSRLRRRSPMPESPRRRPKRPTRSRDRETFALGERSVADLVAPTALEEARDAVTIDGVPGRTLAVTEYPRHVSPNWLGRLIDFDEPLDLSMHLEPLDSSEVLRMLTHRMVELQ